MVGAMTQQMGLTFTKIRNDALDYNREYPEAAQEIATAEPVVRVHLQPAAPQDYRWISASIMPGLVTEDGDFIASQEPVVKRLRRFSGRDKMSAIAKRARRYLGLDNCTVPVEYVERYI